MSLEPALPFEFVVPGIATSQQGTSKDTWKERVRLAARSRLPEGAWLLQNPLAVSIYFFSREPMAGDMDNRVKPILDALSQCVYQDDQLVERLVVQRFEPDMGFTLQNPSALLLAAAEGERPEVYIRVSSDFRWELS